MSRLAHVSCGALCALALACAGRPEPPDAPMGAREQGLVVDSSSDFAQGNDEGGIEHGDGEIRQAAATLGVGAWTPTTPFPRARHGHSAVSHAGWLYVLGGFTEAVHMGRLRPDGTVRSWTATTPLPEQRTRFASFAWNGRIYAIGGHCGNDPCASGALVAPLRADGTVGEWTPTTAPPAAGTGASAAVWNGFVYLPGRADMYGEHADVFMAPLRAEGGLGPWTAVTPLTSRRINHAVAAWDGRLYVVGGDAGGRMTLVETAPIAADGRLGAWRATTALGTARMGHTAIVVGGALYVSGGYDAAGTPLSDVQVARIGADGSLGAWSATTAYPAGRVWHVALAIDNRLFSVGGQSATGELGDVLVAPLDPPQPGAWRRTTDVPNGRWGHATVAWGGRLYVLGGIDRWSYVTDVHAAALNADGTLGAWTATTPLPFARGYFSAAAHGGRIYVLGGIAGEPRFLQVQMAAVNADGTLGEWVDTTPLPAPRHSYGLALRDGRLYVAGGATTAGPLGSVLSSQIGADGHLGTWLPVESLPSGRHFAQAAASDDRLYVVGGLNPSDSYSDSGSLVAPFRADGTLGPWTTTTPPPHPRISGGTAIAGGVLHIAGGYSGTSHDGELLLAPLGPHGLGAWAYCCAFGAPRNLPTLTAAGGFLYLVGGNGLSGGGALGEVLYAPLQGGFVRGWWSRLVDPDPNGQFVRAVVVEGRAPGAGTVSLEYRVAGPDGVFGPTIDRGPIALGVPIALDGSGARWLWVRLRLDGGLGGPVAVTSLRVDFGEAPDGGTTEADGGVDAGDAGVDAPDAGGDFPDAGPADGADAGPADAGADEAEDRTRPRPTFFGCGGGAAVALVPPLLLGRRRRGRAGGPPVLR